MYVTCDGTTEDGEECGSATFHVRFEPPLKGVVECTECGAEREIGSDNYA